MNIIDNNFKMLSDIIKNSSLEDIYQNIRNGFNRIGPDIQEGLENYFDKFPYWGKIKRNNGIYEELYYRAKSLKEHIDGYVWLYDKLGDYRSKKLLFAILNNWYQFDFATLKKIHKEIFQDVYQWAGTVRKVNISKGKAFFCPVENINSYADTIFKKLEKETGYDKYEQRTYDNLDNLYANLKK